MPFLSSKVSRWGKTGPVLACFTPESPVFHEKCQLNTNYNGKFRQFGGDAFRRPPHRTTLLAAVLGGACGREVTADEFRTALEYVMEHVMDGGGAHTYLKALDDDAGENMRADTPGHRAQDRQPSRGAGSRSVLGGRNHAMIHHA